jgi:hypothetical protein
MSIFARKYQNLSLLSTISNLQENRKSSQPYEIKWLLRIYIKFTIVYHCNLYAY